MMKNFRLLLLITSGLFIFSIVVFSFFAQAREPVQRFPATVNRDCAPWDGAAFRVTVPLEGGSFIDIAIWQAPEIQFAKTFTFPDDEQVGNVSYWTASGDYEQLQGSISFQGVQEASSVRGRFKLETEAGQRFEGQFEALWQGQIAICG